MLTLLEARQGPLKGVAGACTNTPEFRSLVNQATRQLMWRGDFKGTVVPIRVCVSSGCVVFNRYIAEVREMRICNIPSPVQSMFGEFLPSCGWRGCCGSEVKFCQWGQIPVFQDVLGDNRLIRAYPRVQADIGKVIRWFGTDNYGQTLRSSNGDGTYSDGVPITLSIPYGSTNTFVRSTSYVIKDETEGPVNVYGYNTVTDKLEDIAQYEPRDTLPSFSRYKLSGCGDCVKSIVALVKLRFIPVAVDTDLVLIDNEDALEMMVQSLKYRQAGDIASARASIIDAVEILNRQLEDSQPDDNIPVSIGGLQQSCVGVQRIF